MRDRLFKRIDEDGDGSVTKEEFSTALSKMKGPQRGDGQARTPGDLFTKIDANSDGVIDKTEHDTFLSSMSKMKGAAGDVASNLFARADKDGDGTVSKDELTQAIESMVQPSPLGYDSRGALPLQEHTSFVRQA